MLGFILNLILGLIAYCRKPEKPSLNITDVEYQMRKANAYADLRLMSFHTLALLGYIKNSGIKPNSTI